MNCLSRNEVCVLSLWFLSRTQENLTVVIVFHSSNHLNEHFQNIVEKGLGKCSFFPER